MIRYANLLPYPCFGQIGQLDCTVHVGLPDTMASLWQQIGRAGRRQTASLAVIIGQQRPLDQHYMRHPDQASADVSMFRKRKSR